MESFDGHGRITRNTCNQLAYLTTAIILWYRASDIIDISPDTIASLIVESVSAHHDTIYVLVKELADLVCEYVERRIQPLQIADHVWEHWNTQKLELNSRVMTTDEKQAFKQQHLKHLKQSSTECIAELKEVFKNACHCVREVANIQALKEVVFPEVQKGCAGSSSLELLKEGGGARRRKTRKKKKRKRKKTRRKRRKKHKRKTRRKR